MKRRRAQSPERDQLDTGVRRTARRQHLQDDSFPPLQIRPCHSRQFHCASRQSEAKLRYTNSHYVRRRKLSRLQLCIALLTSAEATRTTNAKLKSCAITS